VYIVAATLAATACSDLPTEAIGDSEASTTGASSGGTNDDSGQSETNPPLDGESSATSSGTDSPSTTSTTTTNEGDSSSSDTGEPLPVCGDGIVTAGELCHDLGALIAVDPAPDRVAISDLDQDGTLDLFLTNDGSTVVQALWGTGNGSFIAPQVLVDADAVIDDLAIADFSGDGWPDLVLTDRLGTRLVTYAGDTMGDVFFAGQYPTLPLPLRLTVGDVDGDGILDLVAMGTNSASLMLGNGLAGFIAQPPFSVPSGPYWVGLHDLDLDTELDLLTINQSGGNTSCFLGQGGGFGEGVDHDTDSNPQSMAVGDIDENGALDLLVTHAASDEVGVLLGDGLGALGPESMLLLAEDPRTVALADLDSDGHLDMVVAHPTPGLLVLHQGVGDGTFIEGPIFNLVAVSELRVADINADGVPDVVLLEANNSSVQVLLSDP